MSRESLRLRLLGLIALVCLPFPASTATAENLYAELSTGVAITLDQDLSGGGLTGEFQTDPGFAVGYAVGGYFAEMFRAELNLSYRRSEIDDVTAPGVSLGASGDVGLFTAMLNAYVDLLPKGPVIPYVGAGVGIGVLDVNSDKPTRALVVDDESFDFAWNVMGGVAVPVTEEVAFSVGYRYLALHDPKIEARLAGVGTGEVDGEFDSHEVLLGVRVRF